MITKFNKFLESKEVFQHDQVHKEDKEEIINVFKDLFHEFDIEPIENQQSEDNGIYYSNFEVPYVKKRAKGGNLKKYGYNFVVTIDFDFFDSLDNLELDNNELVMIYNDLEGDPTIQKINRNIKDYGKKYFDIINYIYDETKPRLENMGYKFNIRTNIEDYSTLKGVLNDISAGSYIKFTFYF